MRFDHIGHNKNDIGLGYCPVGGPILNMRQNPPQEGHMYANPVHVGDVSLILVSGHYAEKIIGFENKFNVLLSLVRNESINIILIRL